MAVAVKTRAKSGAIMVGKKTYPIRDGLIHVDTMQEANWLVENQGFIIHQMDRWRTAKRVVFKRGRGLGDVLMMGPVMREAKRINPGMEICLACDNIFMDLMRYLPYVNRIVPQSACLFKGDDAWVRTRLGDNPATGSKYDLAVNFDGVVEKNADIGKKHRIDIFASCLNLPPIENKTLDYRLNKQEWEWAGKEFEKYGIREGDKVLGMGLRATCDNRLLPGCGMAADRGSGPVNHKIAELAASDGWKVVLFDHDAGFGWNGNGIVNLTGKTGIRALGAMLARCSMFLGPDSGAWHLACALNVPNVAYFGAINWRLRVTGDKTRILSRNVGCYPCDSYGCPQQRAQHHQCMNFTADEIYGEVAAFWEVAKRKPKIEAKPPITADSPARGLQVTDTGYTGLDFHAWKRAERTQL